MPITHQDTLTQALAFVTAQAYKINTTVYEVQYPDWDIGRLIYVDDSGPEWSPGAMTFVSDMTGKANWFDAAAKDIPLADVSQDYMLKQFHMAAVGYQFNLNEINATIQMGGSLPDRKARAARLAYNRMLYGIAISGDTEKGLTGIINNTSVTVIPAPADGTGSARAWIDTNGVGLKTPAEIVRDINLALQGIATATYDVVLADTLMLPPRALTYIAQTPYSDNTMETILSFVMKTNLYTLRTGRQLTIKSVRELETAGTDTTSPTSAGKGRMIAYNNSPEYLRFHLPMPHRFMPVFQDAPLNWVIPGIFRTGGVEMQSVIGMRYVDGISEP